MRNSRMSKRTSSSEPWTIIQVVTVLALAVGVSAQTNRGPLVELYTNNQGLYFPAGRTLYATIYMNGQIDFMDTSHHDFVVKHQQLSRSEVARVKKMTEMRSVKELQGIVQSEQEKPHQDYQTNLEVTISYPEGVHSFTLRGFDSGDARRFPRGFNEFLCLVDDLKQVEYRLSSGCR